MRSTDHASVCGKAPPIEVTTDLLIVGAGPAGMSAALTAAGRGVRVMLVDENPIPLKTMGEDVPLHFGGRMGAALANQNAVLERLVEANPQILRAMDAGVDVRLGTAVWGLFPQHPSAAWLGGPVAGLADTDSVYLVRFKQVIVATGRRDMGLAFAGWQRPGVMGVSAAHRLASVYEALEARVAVLIGSATEALQAANALAEAGVHIEAIIERSPQVIGSPQLLAGLTSRGARVFTSHVVQEADGDNFGVTCIKIVEVDETGCHLVGKTQMLTCDTVLLGIAAVPTIELVEACGCAVGFQAERGGHVALIDALQRTSLPFVYVAGDCAGVWPSKTLSETVAMQEGRIAANAALSALGASAIASEESPVTPDIPACDISTNRLAWVRASVLSSSADPPVCQCEEVTASEILSLQPPRYLGWTPRTSFQGQHGKPPNPDVVKRLTRAGMGTCQGRRCREQIAALIALDSRVTLADIPLATYRTPVRPLTLAQLASLPESPAMAPHWDSWFGMPTQWIPFWRVQSAYTVATRNSDEPAGGE